MGEKRNAYRMLAGKAEGKRPLRIPRLRWEDNIKMGWVVWAEFIWLSIGSSGRFF
jgi:hypothetical protein